MTRADFVQIFTPLTMVHGALFDQPTWSAYYRALSDVPAPLLSAAVDLAFQVATPWMLKPGEIRALADQARRQILAAHPWEACESCTHGWEAITDGAGVQRMQRCGCVRAYAAKLETLGVGQASLEHEAPRETRALAAAGDWQEPVW